MVRIKGGTTALKHRRKVLQKVKGFRFGRSTKERQANDAIHHAGNYAFAHRRRKKGDFRRLWNIRIGAALLPFSLSYSKFIGALHAKNILINRKMLSELAVESPKTFENIVNAVK